MIVAYLRYSPRPKAKLNDIDGQAASLAVQRDKIARHLSTVLMVSPGDVTWIEDPFVSARAVPLYEREGGAVLKSLLDTRSVTHIVVASLDRLFRDVVDGRQCMQEWGMRKVRLESCDGFGVDISTSHGLMIATMVLSVAEFEPHRTAERTSAAHKVSQSNGKRVSRYPRFGYRFVESGGHVREVADAVEQEILTYVKMAAKQNSSIEAIRDVLQATGLQPYRWRSVAGESWVTVKRIRLLMRACGFGTARS